jgi:hypothetical protein
MDSQSSKMATPLQTLVPAPSEEAQLVLVGRVLESVSRAFNSISPALASVTLWNMMVTQRLGFTDIADRPAQFIEGLRAIYNAPQARLIETKLVKEIQSEFGLPETGQNFPDVVRKALML